jgi:murein DD-endopeptidase MepM/ murein hydrolase activator NlpD
MRPKHRPIVHGLLLAIISLSVGAATFFGAHLSHQSHAFAAPVTGLSMPGVGSSIPANQDTVVRPDTINKTLRAQVAVPTQAQAVAAQFAALSVSPTATPAAADEGAAVRAANVAPPPDLPPYQVYTVAEGDTISAIAAHFGIDPQYIVANNAEIQDSDFLKLGQSIIIPAGNGILHEVRYGETLSDIAARYDVSVDDITGFGPNHITTPDDIKETQFLFVPNGKVPAPADVAAPSPAPSDSPAPEATPEPQAPPAPAPPPADNGGGGGGGIVRGGPSSSHGLIWPVVGPLSSCYCPSHPLGIDIDGYNLAGAPIGAATSGTVIFAGGNACCSYGLYVIVMSPDGIETLYGHLSVISVNEGETVSQGEQLGIIGSTGYSTGRHLHFEVLDHGVRENPLDYLPGPYVCEPGVC